MDIFDVIIFFGLRMIPQKTVKPTYLGPLDARKLAEGKGQRRLPSRKFARFVPFRLIKKRSFHLLCVLDSKTDQFILIFHIN